eukprot:402404-Prymnesium_polylepis.1
MPHDAHLDLVPAAPKASKQALIVGAAEQAHLTPQDKQALILAGSGVSAGSIYRDGTTRHR